MRIAGICALVTGGASYAELAASIIKNPYLNGEVIGLDGAIRMAPR